MHNLNITIESATHADTVRLGRLLAGLLRPGMVIALVGDLGAGKTTLVKGIASGLLNIDEREVTSPTFTIVQEYSGAMPLYHVDAYRLDSALDLEAVGFEDYIDGNGVTVIEWADRITDALPPETLTISIEQHGEQQRCFRLMAATPHQAREVARIAEYMKDLNTQRV
jgi:tRNA threonylcarbamoyladenosine biosynthesis protein TsaE